MSGYIGTQPVPQATQTRDVFTATSGQTSFATSGYTPNFLDVWLNGVKLVNGDDFTATNGSDVVLTTGATAGDTVEVLSYSTYEVNAQTYTGGLTVNNDAATVLTVDRATSDGALIDLQRDGASVGIVGSAGTGIYIGQTDTMLTFFDDNDLIYPSTNGAATRDAAVTLGASNARFKDLYLSGGVYLGGTGAANLLDDYEEGTWTMGLTTTSGSVTVGTNNTGAYTKIGRQVTVTGRVDVSAVSSPNGRLDLTGIPFANALGTEESHRTNANVTFYQPANSQAAISFEGRLERGASIISIYLGTPTNGIPSEGGPYVRAGSEIWINCTYFTDA